MKMQWFYKHAGHVFGPYAGEDLCRLAAIGLLQPADQLWPDGSDPRAAVEATAAIDFSKLPPPLLSPPDWLGDVADAGPSGPQPVAWPAVGTPDWVEDMQRLHQPSGANPPVQPAPAQVSVPPARKAQAEAPRLDAGDPASSGEVARGPQQAESSQALYQRARAAIYSWACLKENKELILSGDCDAVRQDDAVQLIVDLAARCGPDFANRFDKHLEFVVHMRRKHYLAAQ